MSQICRWYDISRQAHYQLADRQRQQRQGEQVILDLVRQKRRWHPRMGARKVLHELQPQLAQKGLEIGRDRFFDLLAQYDLLIPVIRQKRRTTFSGLWRCPNLLPDLILHRPHQVWVCDITYLQTRQGFCYLALVTDAFSRFIVGFDVSTTLAVEGALRALEIALAQTPLPQGLIHHSDHGIQYTCHAYRDRLQQAHMLSSMGQIGNCYDNAVAERVNGILKLEYALHHQFDDLDQAQAATTQAVWLYNHERPHLSLNYLKPVQVHLNTLHNNISNQ